MKQNLIRVCLIMFAVMMFCCSPIQVHADKKEDKDYITDIVPDVIQESYGGAVVDVREEAGKLLRIMLTVVKYAGMAITLWGIFKVVVAIKEDSSAALTTAIMIVILGIFFVCIVELLTALGFVTS